MAWQKTFQTDSKKRATIQSAPMLPGNTSDCITELEQKIIDRNTKNLNGFQAKSL
jgi:hypothetical protein